ncbi:hypothetical protein ABBQ32_009772 [Trebouxia sp. C0010 RCD-2024]
MLDQRRLASAKVTEPELQLKQRERLATRREQSPGRRAYNQRLLSERFLMTVNHPELSVAEASQLAWDAVGPYKPGQLLSAEDDAAVAKTASEKVTDGVQVTNSSAQTRATGKLLHDQGQIPSSSDAALLAANVGHKQSSKVPEACMVGASQTQDQGPGQSQGVQPTIPDRQQANRPEQLQPEQTAEGSSGSKHDADQSTWSAQLLTARRQLGAHPAYSVHTARSQMDIALKYIKVKEGGLERIRKQAETVRNREGGLDHLKGYLHKERCCVETDIELECAKLATLAYVVEVLERSQQNIQNKRVDKASQC